MEKEQIMKAENLWIRYSMAAVLPLAALLTTPAQAISLFDLIDTNGSITVDDKLFDDFRFTENSIEGDASGRTAFDLTNIDVLPWPAPPGGLFDPGPGLEFVSLNDELRITQGPAATPTGGGDLDFVFRVSVIPGGRSEGIKDNTLQAFFDGNEFGECTGLCDNLAEVRERLFLDAGLTMQITEKDVHWEVDETVNVFEDESGDVVSRDFPPVQQLWVVKDLTLVTLNAGQFVEIQRFNQHFSQVPEPTTLALLGMGLAGLAFGRRRKRT